MSLYSMIGLCVLAGILIIGSTLKLILRKSRKDLEGFHGYAKYEQPEMADEEGDGFKTME